jgi:hypothetical protein
MPKPALALLLATAAACSNHDNAIFGSAPAGVTPGGSAWPFLQIDSVNSAFGSQVTLFDPEGHPTGAQAWVIILSDRPGFCESLKANRNLLHEPPTAAFQALVLILPVGRLGTFEIGRPGDEGTTAELIGTVAPGADAGTDAGSHPPAPFSAVSGGNQFLTFISLTDWEDGASNGNFDLLMTDPNNTNIFEFSGQYKANPCDGLDGTVLP